jgi:hypothetical protein
MDFEDIVVLFLGLGVVFVAYKLLKQGFFNLPSGAGEGGGGQQQQQRYGGGGGGSGSAQQLYSQHGGQTILSMQQCMSLGASQACCQDAYNRGNQIKYYEATNCAKCGNKEC